MNRWAWFWICLVTGLVALSCGLMVPVHLRAVDDSVIERAGRNTPPLVEQGLVLVNQKKLGGARLLADAAQAEKIPGHGTLLEAVSTLTRQSPDLLIWGAEKPARLPFLPSSTPTNLEPFTEFVIRIDNREQILDFLQASPDAAVQELLRFRQVTNTVLFPPSKSSSGQALDAALSICGLLLEEGCLAGTLSNSVSMLAASANHGNTLPLEETLMNFLSLGQRFNWSQLTLFVSQVKDVETLRLLSNLARAADKQLPSLFSAVHLSGRPGAVAAYVATFSETGLKDVSASLRFGTGGVQELLQRNQRLHSSNFRGRVAMDFSLRTPEFALILKWFLYLAGGFLLAMGLHFARPPVSILERPLQVRGVHYAREILFALGFLLVVLLLSEPFLASESQKTEFRFQLRLPTGGGVVPAGKPDVSLTLMNQTVLLTMLLFFVLQGLLYIASVVKLAEIRRQKVPPRIKLKLLENEDHLFDAGLYLGFLGTIVSLILVSLGVFKQPSLMAAYSSVSFGISFVVIFKILHLRPARRKLLLEAEAEKASPATASPAASPVTAPPVPSSFPASL